MEALSNFTSQSLWDHRVRDWYCRCPSVLIVRHFAKLKSKELLEQSSIKMYHLTRRASLRGKLPIEWIHKILIILHIEITQQRYCNQSQNTSSLSTTILRLVIRTWTGKQKAKAESNPLSPFTTNPKPLKE